MTDSAVPSHVSDAQNSRYGEVEYGELSRRDAYQSCWEYVHDLSAEQALRSDDPLIQALATLDARIGKRRLKAIQFDTLHPLAARLLKVRMRAEGIHYDE